MTLPNSLSNISTTKDDSTLQHTDHAAHHNQIGTSVNALENHIGLNANDTYSTIAARLTGITNAVAALGAPSGASVDVTSYGAVGIGAGPVQGSITVGTNILNAPGHDFVVGQWLLVRGAGVPGVDSTHPDLTAKVSAVGGANLTLKDASNNNANAGTTVPVGSDPDSGLTYHDDTVAIQAALAASPYVSFPAVTGGYGVNAQVRGTFHALDIPANRTLIGHGYPSRLVRLDSYRWGKSTGFGSSDWRFLCNSGNSNIHIENMYIDGNLQEALDNWPTAPTTAAWNTGVETTVTLGATNVALFPTGGRISCVLADGTVIAKTYTGKNATQLTGVQTSAGGPTVPSGTVIQCAVNQQGYQCLFMVGTADTNPLDDLKVINCTIKGWPGSNRIKNTKNFIVSGCTFNDQHRGQMEISNTCSYGDIIGNIFNGGYDDNIAVNGNIDVVGREANHINIVGNIIRQLTSSDFGHTGNTCIKISGLKGGNVIGNILEGGENTACIIVWDSDSGAVLNSPVEDILVADNNCNNSAVDGIVVRSSSGSRITVRGNKVRRAQGAGILIMPWTPDDVGLDGVLGDPGYGTANILNDIIVTHNEVSDCGLSTLTTGVLKDGIRVDSPLNKINRLTISHNTILRPAAAGIISRVDGNDWHIDSNKIYDANFLNDGINDATTDAMAFSLGTVTRWSMRNNVVVSVNSATLPRNALRFASVSGYTLGFAGGTYALAAQTSSGTSIVNLPAGTTSSGADKTT